MFTFPYRSERNGSGNAKLLLQKEKRPDTWNDHKGIHEIGTFPDKAKWQNGTDKDHREVSELIVKKALIAGNHKPAVPCKTSRSVWSRQRQQDTGTGRYFRQTADKKRQHQQDFLRLRKQGNPDAESYWLQ